MARYAARRVAIPRAYIEHPEDGPSFMPHLEVDGPADVDTGLVDPDGNPIWRLAEPIGFRFRDDEG